MTQPPELIFDVAHGDIGLSRRLRSSLERIRSWPMSADLEVRKKLDDVLAGRSSLRDFSRTELFAKMFDQVPREKIEEFCSKPEHERDELARLGEAELERLRNQQPEEAVTRTEAPARPSAPAPPQTIRQSSTGHVIPGTRKPNREQVFIPDEPDEDDLYFEERRKGGWLQ
ncbi:hypothetical protein [Nocardia sp. NPDC057440]|uniref:hypothetical protein n=1 Tax=Nocardia sp. NPDC057440 TaxID=3346134 RepID=UPI00366C84C1